MEIELNTEEPLVEDSDSQARTSTLRRRTVVSSFPEMSFLMLYFSYQCTS